MVFTQFVFLIRVQVSSPRSVLAGQFRLWFLSVCSPFLPGALYQIPWLVRRLLLSAPIGVSQQHFLCVPNISHPSFSLLSLLLRHPSPVPQPYQSNSYFCVFFCCNRCLAAISYLLFQILYFLSVYALIEAFLLQDSMHLFSLITQFSLARMSYQTYY